MAGELASNDHHGGLIDELGGHHHPLNYTLGLARAAEGAGVQLHEQSAAIGLKAQDGKTRVDTGQGAVIAEQVVLAGDAFLAGLTAPVERYIMPVANYIIATEPLEDVAALIPQDRRLRQPFYGQLL